MADEAAIPSAAVARRPGRPRFGLLDLYLIRGVAGPFLVILLAVGTAMMLERALRLIHELAGRGADLSYFFPILLQLVPYYLDLAIPAAFMVSLVLLVARLDDNLELEAMLASGVSLARIAAPLAALGLVIGAASLVAGGWLEPLGRYNLRTLRAEATNAGRIGRLEPRAFYHPADSFALTFDARGSGGGAERIFVWQRLPDGRELVVTAGSGRIGFDAEDRRFGIDLAGGRYVSARPGRSVPDLVAFDTLAFRESLRLVEASWRRGWDQREMTVAELAAALRSRSSQVPRNALQAELYATLARAALMPLIPLLVLPLAFTTKKGRRGLGILAGGALLAAFHHGMNFAKHLGLSGAADARLAVLAMTALCVGIVLAVFLSSRRLPSHSPIHTFLKPLAIALSRLRGRAGGRRARPRGRTLTAYLGWELAKWTLLSVVAIVLLLQMIDLLERGVDFVSRGLGAGAVARHVLLQLPLMMQQAVPIAALAAAMVTFIGLGRTSEMTAIRAAGISQWRILVMALPVPLLLSVAAFGLSEYAVPRSQLIHAVWWAGTEPPSTAPEDGSRWFRVGDEIVEAERASPDGTRLDGIDIFRRDSAGLLEERLSAASARFRPGGWVLVDVERSRFGGDRIAIDRLDRLDWPSPLQARDVAGFFSSIRSLSSAAARRALGEKAPVSRSEALFATRILRSAAEPLAPIVMLLLALPLAFVAPRTGTAWPSMFYGAGGGLVYLVADGVLTVFAQVGYLPAAVGAWAAPVIAALIGTTVLVYSER